MKPGLSLKLTLIKGTLMLRHRQACCLFKAPLPRPYEIESTY